MSGTKTSGMLAIALFSAALLFAHAIQVERGAGCRSISIKFSLKAGESFEQAIGGGLTFEVRADPGQDSPKGWAFSLNNSKGNDFLAPVNPPLRFNPSQILGSGYSLTAKESMKWDRELRFLLSEADFEAVDPLWRDALWPYSAPDPEHAAEKYTTAIGRMPLGSLQLKILQADVLPDDSIRSATFEVKLTAPASFRFDASLNPRPATCSQ